MFETVKWLGVAYLVVLGCQALRGAWRGDYNAAAGSRRTRPSAFRRKFCCSCSYTAYATGWNSAGSAACSTA